MLLYLSHFQSRFVFCASGSAGASEFCEKVAVPVSYAGTATWFVSSFGPAVETTILFKQNKKGVTLGDVVMGWAETAATAASGLSSFKFPCAELVASAPVMGFAAAKFTMFAIRTVKLRKSDSKFRGLVDQLQAAENEGDAQRAGNGNVQGAKGNRQQQGAGDAHDPVETRKDLEGMMKKGKAYRSSMCMLFKVEKARLDNGKLHLPDKELASIVELLKGMVTRGDASGDAYRNFIMEFQYPGVFGEQDVDEERVANKGH